MRSFRNIALALVFGAGVLACSQRLGKLFDEFVDLASDVLDTMEDDE